MVCIASLLWYGSDGFKDIYVFVLVPGFVSAPDRFVYRLLQITCSIFAHHLFVIG